MKIYLASGWFNPEQKELMDKVRSVLINMGFDVFAPFYDGIVLTKENDSPEMRKKVFDIDIGSIDSCNLVVAIIDDFDPGTIFEMGYAHKGNIPILAYSDVSGRGLNVMLQMAVWGFANGEDQLIKQLEKFKLGEQSHNFLKWVKGDVE